MKTSPTQTAPNTESNILKRCTDALLDLLYPPHCVSCGRAGEWLCPDCLGAMQRLREPICRQCGHPLTAPGRCAACLEKETHLDATRSIAPHRAPLRQAVHALKYEGLTVLADPLGDLMAEGYAHFGLNAEVIMPVPLHPARERRRGHNQSHLLARALGQRITLPVRNDLLRRARNTPAQVGLSRQERWHNVWGAFSCTSDDLSYRKVLLVDDVMTTGATLQACAAALRQAGATHVCALTLTRAGRLRPMRPAAPTMPDWTRR
jgi:ComF family protein